MAAVHSVGRCVLMILSILLCVGKGSLSKGWYEREAPIE